MHEPAGLIGLWTQTDWLGRGVIVTLLAMSVASWWVIVVKALRLLALRRMARQAAGEFWRARDLRAGVALLVAEGAGNPFRALAEAGQEAVRHHAGRQPGLHAALDLGEWVEGNLRRRLDDTAQQLQSGLAVLASVGATAPFVGLLGTVWGIYHALVGLAGSSDAPTLDRVAGPVGEALVMTAFGLLVAIPAVLAYNALLRGNKGVLVQLRGFAHDLHALLVTGARVGGGGDAAASPAPSRREEA